MPSVGAVVVTFQNSVADVSACLSSLQENQADQIVVVDNDLSSELGSSIEPLPVRYLSTGANLGFGAAANLGASSLSTDYLLFINPDASLLPNALAFGSAYLTSHPMVDIVGFLMHDQSLQPDRFGYGRLVTPISLLTRHLTASPPPRSPRIVGWVSGGAMLITHSLFRQLGGFDPDFFLYWEDVDLCYRAHLLRSRCVLLPAARVIHRRGASLSDIAQRGRYYDQSADKYFRKHYPKTAWLLRLFRQLYRHSSPLPRP